MIFDNYKPNYINPKSVNNVAENCNAFSTVDVNDSIKRLYSALTKKNDYLYEITFDDEFDYKFANDYFSRNYVDKYPKNPALCSAVRKGNFYGRNMDWFYDEEVSFIMKTVKTENRFASIGVGGYIPTMTKESMENTNSISLNEWKLLPFRLLDGINEYGVFCNDNVVPTNDMGLTTGTNYGVKPEISTSCLVRYVLDHFRSAEEAVNSIKNNLSIYSNLYPFNKQIETHLMIGDLNKTYIVEFQNNECVVKEYDQENDYAIMTNFYENIDGLINSNVIDYSKSTPYGMGFERWNLIANKYDSLTTLDSVKELMRNDLKYTNAYRETVSTSEGKWFTENAGKYGNIDLTVQKIMIDEDPQRETVYDYMAEQFKTAERDGKFWQTCHSSIYDLENKKLYVTVQEDSETEYVVEFDL